MFVHNNMVTATPCEPGVSRKVMAYNDQVMMCEITFEKGAKGNFHTHPHVQTTYINACDSILMPSNALHGCECLEAGVLCDVFTPMREDFIKK